MLKATLQAPQMQAACSRIDQRVPLVILVLTLTTYAYIFQGLGWNQMAHFGTIRSLVERGTADISPFAADTQDTMVLGNRQYSDKPPGLALLGVPFYWALIHVERSFGADYLAPAWRTKNMHALTVLLCALPGAAVNVLLYFAFRREGATPRAAMLVAGGFAFGSLSLPYSGLFMSHLLCSLLVFAAWYKLTNARLEARDALLAGALIGYSNLCDLLTVLVTAGLAFYLVFRQIDLRCWLLFALGPVTALFTLLVYDRLAHGNATQISAMQPTAFLRPHLLLGQFDWPDVRRLYWITYQPMRGLISCCPEFVLCLFAPLLLLRRTPRARPELLLILPVVAGYLFFYMTYFGWSGGWSLGPRFLIPVLPLVWMFALRPARQMPLVSGIVIALSVLYMLAVTSVCPVSPAVGNGPPTTNDPVKVNLSVFFHGNVNDSDGTETLGGLIGVPKRFLIFPFLLPVAAYFCIAFALPAKATSLGASSVSQPD